MKYVLAMETRCNLEYIPHSFIMSFIHLETENVQGLHFRYQIWVFTSLKTLLHICSWLTIMKILQI